MRSVHVLLPDGVDDPVRPSGGNVYDRRVCRGLAARGWSVRERVVPGAWPAADLEAVGGLGRALAAIPDDAVVLVDGLVASAAPEVLVPAAERVRVCVLLHLPLGATTRKELVRHGERAVLRAAATVLTTSGWTRRWLVGEYGLDPGRVHAAPPGVDPAPLAPGTAGGGRLLCVAAVTGAKGHDLLVAALAELHELPWQCVCVGTVRRDPDFVDRLRQQALDSGVADRVHLVGARRHEDLAASYASSDLLVLATRFESYGMVVTEALAHGLPVVTTDVGALPATLGRLPGGCRPGLLVPPEDPAALAGALGRWLRDRTVRESLRAAARLRRASLSGWETTTDRLSRVLSAVAA